MVPLSKMSLMRVRYLSLLIFLAAGAATVRVTVHSKKM